MSIEKAVLEKLLKLPADKQKEVLDFVETLEKKTGDASPPEGLWPTPGQPCHRKTSPRLGVRCG
jgi:hypothetical protein